MGYNLSSIFVEANRLFSIAKKSFFVISDDGEKTPIGREFFGVFLTRAGALEKAPVAKAPMATAKKAPVKKATAKKAVAKKTTAKKAVAKKATAKKAPAKADGPKPDKIYPFGTAPYGSNQWYSDLRAICASHIKKNILRKIGKVGDKRALHKGVKNIFEENKSFFIPAGITRKSLAKGMETTQGLKERATNPAQIMEIFLKDGIEEIFQTTLETILRQGREEILDYAGKKENLFQVMGFVWNQFKMHLQKAGAKKRDKGLAPVSVSGVSLLGNSQRPEQSEVEFADLLSSLSEEERALALALSEDKTFKEIGDSLGISKQAAHKRVAKLRAKFTRSNEGGLKEKFLKADLSKGRVEKKYSKDVDGVWRTAYVPQIPVGEPVYMEEVPLVGMNKIFEFTGP